jgi:hypothetical protein
MTSIPNLISDSASADILIESVRNQYTFLIIHVMFGGQKRANDSTHKMQSRKRTMPARLYQNFGSALLEPPRALRLRECDLKPELN